MAYVYDETIAVPFWAEGKDFIGGRDPLGIQNSSVSIYSTLLPGLNNVTERLRYYGFYCWLLTCIKDRDILFNEPREQHNFIRKAEYTLALYMALCEAGAGNIAGIDYANKQVQQSDPTIPFNIKKGAEKHPDTKKGSVYWDFGSGALGQYYAGSLIILGLIKTGDKYFFITPAGEELGRAFGKSIDPNSAELLFNIINKGSLSRIETRALSAFSLQTIKPGSEEWELYIKIFFSSDYYSKNTHSQENTTYRRDTWLLFIHYLLKCEDTREWEYFPAYLYDNKGFTATTTESPASIGWLYYFTNELIHFGLESIFSIILKTIEQHPVHINTLIEELTSQCLKTFENYYTINENILTKEFIKEIDLEYSTTNYPYDIHTYLKEFNIGETLVWAFELILKVYKETQPYLEKFNRFTFETETREKRATALEFYEEHINLYLEKPFGLFIERSISKIINDHLYIAYLKMGNGEGQVHKMLAEDNYLVHIANINPRFTTPRLGTVRNFMEDLKLIYIQNNKYKLTTEGMAVLKNYNVQ